ncbi:MAG: 50S ribosomal protein L25 [Verrucomicrobia subdivision 3 bacterium]|nr:50S ribosomal protein L25 [Limisphaerales bacterium]MCS1412972.1 50S ribosomal protein L25 [Limisphaerales bacterium]
MKAVPLSAETRSVFGRNRVKKIRANGRIPSVLYGKGEEPAVIDISEKDFERLVYHSVSENVLVDLSIEGDQAGKHLAMIQEVDHHPLSGKVLHVDFHKVSADEPVTITVPIETKGEAVGVKTSGGTLEHVLFRAKLKALPEDLPAVITIDVTEMQAGEILHLGEVPLPEGVEILGNASIPVITITAPRVKTDAAEAEGEDGKEKK